MEFFDVMKPENPAIAANGQITNQCLVRDIILIELLKQVDIRNTTLFIAAQYANMYNTVWKDNPQLIHQYYSTHQRELSLFIKMKLDRVVNRLLDQASEFVKSNQFLGTVKLDAATTASVDNMLSELQDRANNADLSNALITSVNDLLNGKPYVRTGILRELEVFEIAIRGNREAYKADERNTRWRTKPSSNIPLLITKLYSILTGIVRSIRYKSADVCYNYKEWASLLSIIYMLYTDPCRYTNFFDSPSEICGCYGGANPFANMFTAFTPEEAICDCGHLNVTVDAYRKTHNGIRERNDNPLVKSYLRLQYMINGTTKETGV